MRINAIKKGKAGEVEFCLWLDKNLNIKTERNYNQANGFCADIIVDDFIFEIKRQEALCFNDWWYQVTNAQKAHKTRDLIPIVAFRQNRKKWNFLIPANLINGLEKGFLISDEKVFLQFAKNLLENKNEII